MNKQLLSCSLKSGKQVTMVVASVATDGVDQQVEISYYDQKVIGNGSFGVVFLAKLSTTNEMVAIKKVLQDKRFKNRELQIMRKLNHPNIVKLKYFFYSSGDKKDELYLNLILEYVPETVYRVARHYSKQRQQIPMIYVKLYMYQLLRSLAYIHSIGICHRDIKPQNLLIDPESGVLKLCDFGSAKYLVRNEPNVSYICSRYYRAPELIFGATNYTNSIDVWSAGTVMAELLLGQPIFPGDSGVDQLVEIIKVLGTPTREQIQSMNPNYKEFKFPQIKAHPWNKVFRLHTPTDAIDLISKIIEYTPTSRHIKFIEPIFCFYKCFLKPTTTMLYLRSPYQSSDRTDSWFDEFNRGSLFPYWRSADNESFNFSDTIGNIVNDETKFAIQLDVSHFKPEELKIQLDGRELKIEGFQETRTEHGCSKRSFSKMILLPEDADLTALKSAISNDGKLQIDAPKTTVARSSRSIPINFVAKH